MSRLHFKGGPWTNQEDQFLLAALNKYGLRDWARVASVLQNKTAPQCRERYENYLDAGLHLTEEWSLEEEEELLKLQSLFPYKWRTIADQITRRTSTHYRRPPWLCEQHYQKLLDAHEFEKKQAAAQRDGEPEMSFGAFMEERRRRRGKQLAHEERAARADTTATASEKREAHDLLVSRLANQDQKKGLRKQRKQQQQETSYLAKLENNREAIEAGTLSGRQRKRMRQAIDEDRQGRATVLDRIVEDDDDDDDGDAGDRLAIDDDDDDGDEALIGRRAGRRGARAGGARAAFTPVDMLEDLAQAGLQKQARKLYGGHLEALAAGASASRRDGGEALPIHHDLLDRLLASDGTRTARIGDATTARLTFAAADDVHKAPTTTAPTTTSSSTSSGLTWDALTGPSTDTPDLDALFAALPEAGASAPKQAKKEKTRAPVAAATDSSANVDDIFAVLPPLDSEPAVQGREVDRAEGRVSHAMAAPAERPGDGAVSALSPVEAVPVRSREEYATLAKAWVAEAVQSPEIVAPALHDEAFMSVLQTARQAVEAEVTEGARQSHATSSDASAITPAAVAETQRLMRTWAEATVREDERAVLESHFDDATQLAVARRRRAFERLEALVGQCFVDPQDVVLAGGRALANVSRPSHAFDEEAQAETAEVAEPGTVLNYVAAYWANVLQQRRGQATLLRRVREEEVAAMQQTLDSLKTALSGTLAEERRLQAEYRARQLHAKPAKST